VILKKYFFWGVAIVVIRFGRRKA